MTDAKPPVQFFDWAAELSDAQGHVTLSAKEAKEIGARLRSMGDPLVTAAPDVSGYVSEWASGICTADEAMAGIAKLYGAQAAPTTQPAPQQEAQEPAAYVHVPHYTVEGKVRPVVSFEKYQQDYADGIYSTRIPLYTAPQSAPDCHHRPPCDECAAIAAQGGK